MMHLVRDLRPGEEPVASELAIRVFDQYVGPSYSAEGRASYHAFASAEAMAARRATTRVWIAEEQGRMVAMLEVRDGTHVAMLFVEGTHQGRGLARQLLEAAFGAPAGWPALTVNSAPNAVAVYERLGFVAVDEMREQDGIRFLPMRREAGTESTGAE